MQAHPETILIIVFGGGLARSVVHAIRDRQVYSEVISRARIEKEKAS